MLGSAVFRTGVAPGGALAGPWVKNELWNKARSVPSLDLRFADNKSLVDATTGQNLVTFTRASSGTYVDSQGVIRTATTNLLLRSEEFDNAAAWQNQGSTDIANNATAPNGTLTADEVIEDSATGNHYITQSFTSTTGIVYTFSCYVKAANRTFCFLVANGAGTVQAISVNLSTGVASSATGSPSNITSVSIGNGWYRVSFTYTSGTTGAVGHEVRLSTDGVWANRSYTGNGTGSVYAWGAQLEQSSTVGEYIPTTSTINSAPRFDHAITSSVTNLLVRSEEFDNASWTKNDGPIVTANQIAAPNGTLTADQMVGNGSVTGYLEQAVSIVSGLTYTFSVYMKKRNTSTVNTLLYGSQFNSGGGNAVATWNLDTGSASFTNGATGSMIAVGNGWYRCVMIDTATVTNVSSLNQWIRLVGNSGDVYLWGAQLEQSSTAGEYVQTTTAPATASKTESLGLLVEEQRTNSIRNNTMVGAVAGTPGTLPTNWTGAGSSGLAREVVGTGTESGIAYVDVRYFGTTTSALYQNVSFEVTNQIAAAQSSIWTSTAFVKLVGGSLANITSAKLVIDNYNSSNVSLGQYAISNFVPTTAALATQRYSVSSTSSTFSNAATAFVRPYLQFEANSGAAIDITLRIGMPQLEQGAFATSVIPTTTATVTRSLDVASITGSNFSPWYRQDEGTLYGDYLERAFSQTHQVVSVSNGTASERISMAVNSSNVLDLAVISSGVDTFTGNTPTLTAQAYRIGFAYKSDSSGVSANGSAVTDDSAVILPTVSQLDVGARGSSQILNSTIRRLTYFPTRLANETLQRITQ